MKIVLVIDQFDDSNNGTTVTARRFAGQLRDFTDLLDAMKG